MSFAEALTGAAKKPGGKCGAGQGLATFTGKDHAALVDALAGCGPGHAVSYSQLARALKTEGIITTSYGIGRHVDGSCSCGPR